MDDALSPDAVRAPERAHNTPLRWELVDPLLIEGRVTLKELTCKLGVSHDLLRQRCRKLGLPPRRGALGYRAVVDAGRVVDLLECGHVVAKKLNDSAKRRFCPECQERDTT